jgi:hypothetical protein
VKSWRFGETGKRRAGPPAAVHCLGQRVVGFCLFGTPHFYHQIPLNPTRSDRIPPIPSGRPSANPTQSDLIRPNPTKISNLFSIPGKVAPGPALHRPGSATDNPVKANQTNSNQFKPPPPYPCGPHFDQFRVISTNFDRNFFTGAPDVSPAPSGGVPANCANCKLWTANALRHRLHHKSNSQLTTGNCLPSRSFCAKAGPLTLKNNFPNPPLSAFICR